MPIVIFIAQRLILFLLAILTFLGLSSEERYFAIEQEFIIQQERKGEIVELLRDDETPIININPEPPELDMKKIGGQEPKPSTPTKSPIVPNNSETRPRDFIDSLTREFNDVKKGITDTFTQETEVKVIPSTPAVDTNDAEEGSFDIANIPSNAVLNLVCLERSGRSLSLTTGSAVIISKSGYVLTNAHVAQFMLKQDQSNIDCELRHAHHKTMNFRAVIHYIPEQWKDGSQTGSTTGTGEHDYAILKITGPGPDGIMPTHFPYISPETSDRDIYEGNDILLIAYPGKNTGNFDIDGNLPLVSHISTIQEIFTFKSTSSDVFSSGVSPVARQGSSGGAVVDDGQLLGIIVTTNETSSGTVLNAISLNYINRNLKEQGLSLSQFK